MTSLITTYVTTHKKNNATISQTPQKYNQNDFRTNAKATLPVGHTVQENCLNPYYALKNDAVNFKYMLNGIRGEGTDHSVGKVNDIALKMGGIGIASVIAASKSSVLQKSMEFAGLGCWLATMSLWPKLGVYKPIQLLKGPNLSLQYENSAGEKKNFYQDPQYLCWDLVPENKKQKIGDKLGVQRNMPNRIQEIENLSKQTAIQGSTIAMLTAGVATPVFASLAGDQMEKRVVSPLLTKFQEKMANSLIQKLTSDVDTPINNEKISEQLSSILDSSMSTQQKNESVKKLFSKIIGYDTTMLPSFEKVVDDVLDPKSIAGQINLTEKINSEIAGKLTSRKNADLNRLLEIIHTTNQKYNNVLTDTNIDEYLKELGKELKTNKITSGKNAKDSLEQIRTLFNLYKTSTSPVAETYKKQLLELSNIAQEYGTKVYRNFDKKFLQYIWNNDVSTNASIWRDMDTKLLSLIGFSNSDIKTLGSKPSDKLFFETIDKVFSEIISDNNKFKGVISKLSNFASKEATRNEKYITQTLEYLDKLENMFSAFAKNPEFAGLTNDIKVKLSSMRQNILNKYISTNQNLYTPIRVLDFLRENRNNPNIDITAFKKMLFSHQQVDSFINKMDNFSYIFKAQFDTAGNFVKNKDEVFKCYIDRLFSSLSEETKQIINNDTLTNNIDNSTQLLKNLLIWQSDGTNVKFVPHNSDEVVVNLKKMNLFKYIDEIFSFGFKDKNPIAQQIVDKLRNSSNKNEAEKIIETLKTFLHFSTEDITKLQEGNTDVLWKHLTSFPGKPFLERNNTNKIKELIKILDIQTPQLSDIEISRAFPISASGKQGKTLEVFIKESAEQITSYKKWFKRVGIAGLILIGVTGLAIMTIGKKTEQTNKKSAERNA